LLVDPDSNQTDSGVLSFESITDEQFREYFDFPRVVYEGNESLDGVSAVSLINQVPEDWSPLQVEIRNPFPGLFDSGVFSADEILLPFVNLLYLAEIGAKNEERFFNDEEAILFPESTDAINFIREHCLAKTKDIRGIRHALELLIPTESLTLSGFVSDIGQEVSLDDKKKARAFIATFKHLGGSNINWKTHPKIKYLKKNILY